MGTELLPEKIRELYDVYEWRHACAILRDDFPAHWKELVDVLSEFRIPTNLVSQKGGGKSAIAKNFETAFQKKGWEEKKITMQVEADGKKSISATHKIDCYKDGIALEVEWNSKNTFFDRDLNIFRILFDMNVISVGIIITRADNLSDIAVGRDKPFYGTTSRMGTLRERLDGGGSAGCPVLALGITDGVYVDSEGSHSAATGTASTLLR